MSAFMIRVRKEKTLRIEIFYDRPSADRDLSPEREVTKAESEECAYMCMEKKRKEKNYFIANTANKPPT